MNRNTRIELSDDIYSIMTKMCEGNPGALTVLINLIKETERIDPDAAMGPYAHLLNLDSAGIYGPRIWVLFKDTCGQNLTEMIAVLRGWQLGFVSQEQLDVASSRDGARGQTSINVSDILAKVKAELPKFGTNGA